ncbi:MAG: hypothetical protein IJ219_03265 [Bacteroidaceae bacterium]|nr:hypothetical protein [Bacteroidaceae bacterium]
MSDFSMSQEDFSDGTTRAASSVADYTGVKSITLAFFKADGTKQSELTQLRSDASTYETFGQFALELPVGGYKMVVIAHANDMAIVLPSMTEANFGEEKTRETFCYTQDVVISNATPNAFTPTLNRINSRVCAISTDQRPADVNIVRITFSAGSKSFNPLTGLATANTGYTSSIVVNTPLTDVVKTRADIFLTTDEQTMDVTIETLDDNGNVLFSKVVKDVPFKRNRATLLTGSMYSPGSVSASFSVEAAWQNDYNINF